MSDAIRDVLEDIFGGASDRLIGAEIGVAHTTISRMRRAGGATPNPLTVAKIATIATPQQTRALRRVIAEYGGIRMPHPQSAHPDPLQLARDIAGKRDPVERVALNDATFHEALRLAAAALRTAAAAAPTGHRKRVARFAARVVRFASGVSHG